MTRYNSENNLLPGARYRATHQSSVDAILTPLGLSRKVVSSGSDFVNVDNWHLRVLAAQFCKHYSTKPLDIQQATELVRLANKKEVKEPHINIAETPEKIPVSVALALVGSAYHESWHTKYSSRDPVDMGLVMRTFPPRQQRADWSKLSDLLLLWMNLVDDIFIERQGCRDFPGAQGKMEYLQDFVLEKEAESFKKQPPDQGVLLLCIFRDIGKGYKTELTQKTLEQYREIAPVAYDIVTQGPLKLHLDRTCHLRVKDSTECLPLAMDILTDLKGLQNPDAKPVAGHSREEVKQVVDSLFGANHQKVKVSDAASILKEAFEKLNGTNKKIRQGDEIFRPLTTSYDKIQVVNSKGATLDIPHLHASVKEQTSYLRSRMKQLFNANELVDVEHGLRHGRHVSGRMLAESIGMVRSDYAPERPFYDKSEAPDLSMAAVVMVDESSSMARKLKETCRIVLCLTDALEAIRCKTAVAGFMKTEMHYPDMPSCDTSLYHRFHSMTYHLFKTYDDRFATIKSRFGALKAESDTPMGDGINFALNLLEHRNEGHRFIFMVTDGSPDDTGPVLNRLALAQSIGVKVIAIGLGRGAEYVQHMFPDHVWCEELYELPALLVRKLTSIVDKTARHRGKRLDQNRRVA